MEDRINSVLAELAATDAKREALEKELHDLRIKNLGKLDAEKGKAIKDAEKQLNTKQFQTAQSARQTAENTSAVRNHIAKFIQEEAKEGRTQLNYGVYYLCEAQLNGIITELSDLGYDVEHKTDECELIIMW